MISYNPRLKILARELRMNMTDAERLLWSKIRGKRLKGRQFYRQKPIGNHIVDFYCPSAKLIIELDGGQHFTEEGKQKDRIRDSHLADLGLKIRRYSDIDVLKNVDGVLKDVYELL